jgi:hypothetical protein
VAISDNIVVEPATEKEAETVAEEAAAEVETATDKVESVTENAFGRFRLTLHMFTGRIG